jgi:hypothetical protein
MPFFRDTVLGLAPWRQQLSSIDLKCVGKRINVLQRDVALATLNRSDVGSMKPGKLGQSFLRESRGEAKCSDIQAKGSAPVQRRCVPVDKRHDCR